MNGVLFIKAISNFEYAKRKGFIKNKTIIPLTFAAFYEMEQVGAPAKPIWEYVENCELQGELKADERIIEDVWFSFFRTLGEYESSSRIVLFPLILFLNEALASSLFIKSVLDTEKPDNILNFMSGSNKPCKENAGDCTVFDSILKFKCIERNIPYHELIDPAETTLLKSEQNGSLLKDKIVKVYNHLAGIFLTPYWWFFLKQTDKDFILISVSQSEYPRHIWFLRLIEQALKVKVLNLRQGTFKHLNIGFANKIRVRVRGQRQYRSIKSQFFLFKNKLDIFPDILCNPFLNFEWEYLLRELVFLKLKKKLQAHRYKQIFAPTMVILPQAMNPHCIASSIAFQELGVKSFLLPHATIPFGQKYLYNYHNKILATGKFQFRKLHKMGVESDRIIRLNDRRYDSDIKPETPDEVYEELKDKYNTKNKKVILVVTDNIHAGCGFFPKWETKLSMEKTFRFLKVCAELHEMDNGYKIIFKSHPHMDCYDLYDAFVSVNPHVMHCRNDKIGGLLVIADLVIIVGPFTDVIFEAAVQDKKLVFCDCGADKEVVDIISRGACVVKDPVGLGNVVKEIMAGHTEIVFSNEIIRDEFLTID